MKPNPLKWLLNDEDKRPPVLLAVTPPRTGERTLLGVENMLGSIAVPEPFSLELAGDMDGVTLLARCLDDQVVRGQIAARYPQAQIQQIPAEDDPLRLGEDEQAWGMTLRADGPEYVPLRTFRDDDLLDPGSDPLIALMGALSNLNQGERVVARLLLRSLGPDWSEAHLDKAHKRPGMEPREPAYTYQTKPLQMDGITMAVLGTAALAAVKGYLWVQAGETWKAVLMGAGIALALTVGGLAWHRWKKARSRVHDPLLIQEKVSRIAFDAELEVTAVLPADTGPRRARELLGTVAAAYRHYDNPAGARFKTGKVRPAVPDPEMLHPTGPGFFGKRSVMGVREAACLWHPPGAGDETPLVARAGARVLMPTARSVSGGAHVGDTTTGAPRKIHFPDDLLRRHHLYVARTRMGKSTLMHHIVAHKMREKAAGRDSDAIVVVDPHADLVAGLLQHVPPESLSRPGAAHRPGRRAGRARRQPAGHPHLRRPGPHRRLGGARRQGPMGAVGAEDAVHPRTDRQDPPRGQREQGRGRAVHHPRRAAHPLGRRLPLGRAGEGLRSLPAPVVGQGLRELAARDPRRRPGPGADPPLLLRILQAGKGRPRPVPLHHRHAPGHPGGRHPAGVHRPGHGGPGRGRPGGRVPPQPGGRRDTGAGKPALRAAAGRAGRRGRDAVDARRGLRVDAERAGEVRRQLHPGNPEPRQAGRPLPHHARHPARQRGLPGRLPGGRERRPPAGVGAGQGAGDRGRHHVAAGAPVLRPRHRGNGADGRLLHEGQETGRGRPGNRRAHPRRRPELPHGGQGHGRAGRGAARPGGQVPQRDGEAQEGPGPGDGGRRIPGGGPAQAAHQARPEPGGCNQPEAADEEREE